MKRLIGLLILMVLVGESPLWALHPFYEQNGDCYLMIGDGAKRSVYSLNNLTGGAVVGLYDPFDAYGITASQKWDGAKSLKDLYTFAGTESALTPLTGMIPRRVMTSASSNLYDVNTVPPFTVHRFHGAPNQGPTGRGNHPRGTINSLFGGTDYPCSIIPADVATMPGYQWVPYGKFYHARDVVVWSNWTYAIRRSTPPAGEGSFNPITWGIPLWATKIPPGPWDTCCAGNYPGNGFIRGGWVRRLLRENLKGKYRNLKLYSYRVGGGATVPTLNRDVANVLTQVTGTVDKNGECCDGCIAKIDNEAMPGVPSPYLDCVYSSQVDRTYLYRRDFGSSDYSLLGSNGNDTIIGSGNDLTCKFLGISSKDAQGNYVYLLGLNTINKWLNDANANPDMLLNELTDIAVSDQWWQKGGIVYAYDRTKKKVYQFVRNEGGVNGIPNEIDVSGSGLPDGIGADGFGSLYMLKTSFEPISTAFTGPQAYSHPFLATAAGGISIYRAKFRQNVYKSVTKRDYYSGAFSDVSGRVLLGMNEFYHDCTPSLPTTPGSWSAWGKTWVWWGSQGQFSPIVNSEVRAELAVINSTTPPRVDNSNGVIDCNGPMIVSDGFKFAVADSEGYFPDDQDYYFMVENSPDFDSNGINSNSTSTDVDGDGNSGVFPTTTKQSTLAFYWKVIQTKDRYGSTINETLTDQEASGTPGNYFFYFPPGPGEFKVGVKARYQYYDYNMLPLGALASSKESVLTPMKVAAGGDAQGYSWQKIRIKQVPPPLNLAVGMLMSGRPDATLGNVFRPQSPTDNGSIFCDTTNPTPPSPGFILNGKNLVPLSPGNYQAAESWALKVRESSYNLAVGIDRIASMTAVNPPDPQDLRMIKNPNTLAWVDPPLFNWKSTLVKGTDVIIEEPYTTPDPVLPLAGLRKLLPIPSQPASYTIMVDASRRFTYRTFIAVYKTVAGQLVRTWVDTPKVVKITISASASVCVTDTIGPRFEYSNPYTVSGDPSKPPTSRAFFLKNDLLYGTTGETLLNVDSPPTGYSIPTALEFVVGDNNPFANDTTIINNGTDRFHGSNPLWGLTINHQPGNRNASFSYTTAALGCMPPASPIAGEAYLTNWYKTGLGADYKVSQTDVASPGFDILTGTSGLFNRSFSYRKISIALSDVKHFSRPIPPGPFVPLSPPQPLSPNMDLEYANNLGSYENLNYGIAWCESCGLATTPSYLTPSAGGQIVIRDNDRPNAFVKVAHEKDPSAILISLSNVNCIPPLWRQYTTVGMPDSKNNGIENWTGPGKLNAYFQTGFLIDALGSVTTSVFPSDAPFETDVPMLVTPLVTDNIGGSDGVATVTFQLSSGTAKLIDSFPGTQVPMQYIFTSPGEYKVTLAIQDKALGWPSNPKALHRDQVALAGVNKRNLEAIIKVVGFRLDTRIIERTRQGR
ncbi:MAG: hypothetical protein WA705_01045 [Candidatus Ozemobacteraceae bacterium]